MDHRPDLRVSTYRTRMKARGGSSYVTEARFAALCHTDMARTPDIGKVHIGSGERITACDPAGLASGSRKCTLLKTHMDQLLSNVGLPAQT